MRKLFIGATFMGALVVAGAGVGCDETSSGGKEAPTPSAAPVPSSAPSAAPNGSAKPEKEKADKDKPDQDKEKEKKAEAPKDHKARLKAIEEAWGSHDAKKVAALYAEDGVLKRPGSPDLKGREAIEKRVAQNFAAFKDMTIVPGRVWEKDKKIIVLEWVIKGTHTGDLPESRLPKASNKPFGVVGASWISVNDEGFIKEEHNYLDSETLVGQLGEKEKEKHAVRAVVTTVPDGTAHHQASTAKEIKDAKDEKEKAELAKELELEKKNLEVEDKFAAEMNGNKVDEALKRLPEDFTMVDYTQEKDVKGKKAFKELLKTWFGAFPEMKAKITDSFGDGEFAVMEFEYTGVQKGPLGPIKATNKPVSLHQLEVDELKDGKIVKVWSWGNSVEMLRELGVVPPAGAAPSAAPSGKPAPEQK